MSDLFANVQKRYNLARKNSFVSITDTFNLLINEIRKIAKQNNRADDPADEDVLMAVKNRISQNKKTIKGLQTTYPDPVDTSAKQNQVLQLVSAINTLEQENDLLSVFLPEEVSAATIRGHVVNVIRAQEPDINKGKVMKSVTNIINSLKLNADMSLVNTIVDEELKNVQNTNWSGGYV